nr:MAG TPA: hypothetical protein [Caudoviricetes sp.]
MFFSYFVGDFFSIWIFFGTQNQICCPMYSEGINLTGGLLWNSKK